MIHGANFHRITGISVTQTDKFETPSGVVYFLKSILLTDDKGTKFEICCFSDTEKGLEIKHVSES